MESRALRVGKPMTQGPPLTPSTYVMGSPQATPRETDTTQAERALRIGRPRRRQRKDIRSPRGKPPESGHGVELPVPQQE